MSQPIGSGGPGICRCGEYETCAVCLDNERRREVIRTGLAPFPPRPGVVGQYDPADTYEPIKVIDAHNLNFNLGNVIKYVLRAGKKPGVADIEDLQKAKQYIEFEIARRGRLL